MTMTFDPRRWWRRIALFFVGLGLVAAAGCSAGDAASRVAPAAESVPMSGEAAADGAMPEEGGPLSTADRQIARYASIDLVVADIERASDELRRVAGAVGGLITSESLSLPVDATQRKYPNHSVVVVTVPATRLDEALTAVAGLGEVTQRSVESVDVTDAVVDVDARVTTMRESIERLQELMARAGSVTEIARVESELTGRQAELEALLAQQKSLSQQVETSPITVSLVTRAEATSPALGGFLPGLEAGWNSMVTAGQVALTVLGALLPYLVLAAVVVVPVVLVRRRRRTRATTTTTVPTPGEE